MRFHGLEQDERRRAPRVPGQFLVMVQGVDGGLVARRGDVSEVGVIFGADAMGLEVGSLEYLHLMSMDRTVGVVVMAQVARVVSIQSVTNQFSSLLGSPLRPGTRPPLRPRDSASARPTSP